MPQQTIEIVAKDKTRAALGNVEKRLKRIDKTAASTTKSFGSMGGKIAALGAALGTALGVKSIITVNARFQDLRTTLASVTGSAQKGAEAFKFVNKFATQTQFGIEELSVAYTKLASNGIQPSAKLLTTFTDAAAVTTDQIGSLTAMTDFYTRSLQSQTVELMDLDRLADRGLPVYDILKEKLGISRAELGKFSKEAGNTTLIIEALGDGINERFGGATEARLGNLSTRMSNLNIAMKIFKDKIGTELNEPFGNFLEQITNGITNSDELARTIGRVLGSAVSGISVLFEHAKENADTLFLAFGAMAGAAGAAGLASALGTAKKAIMALSVAIRMNPIGLMVTAVAALIGALAFENGLGKTLAQITAAIDVVGGAFKEFGNFIIEKLAGVVDKIKKKFTDWIDGLIDFYNKLARLTPGLEEVKKTSEELGKELNEGMGKALEYAADQADKLKKAVIDAVPEEVVDVTTALADAVKEAGEAYEQAQKDAKKFNQEQQKKDQALAGPLVAGGGVTLAGAGESNAKIAEMERKEAVKKAIEDEKRKAKEILTALKSRINSTIDALKTERETEVDLHNQRIGDIREFFKGSLHEQRKGQELARKEQLRHEKAMANIRKSQTNAQVDIFKSGQFAQLDLSEMTNDQLVDFTKQAGMDVLNSMAQQNKKAFQLQKALNISMAIMNTAKGVTNALGTVPFPFNLAVAGLIGAAGAVQIGAIASQQYTGRRFGGPVSNDESYIVGENGPELFTPGATGRITANEGMVGGGQTINFNITATDAKSVDELIVQRKPMIVNMIRQATIERGNRPAF